MRRVTGFSVSLDSSVLLIGVSDWARDRPLQSAAEKAQPIAITAAARVGDTEVRQRRSASVLQLRIDDAGAHRSLQRGVVALGLVGIGEREFAHRVVELAAIAEIPADRPGV